MDQVETKVFVVASPQIAAVAIARALRSAGWAIGGSLGSPSALADSSVAPNDVIVVTENMSGQVGGARTETVMTTLRRVFQTVMSKPSWKRIVPNGVSRRRRGMTDEPRTRPLDRARYGEFTMAQGIKAHA